MTLLVCHFNDLRLKFCRFKIRHSVELIVPISEKEKDIDLSLYLRVKSNVFTYVFIPFFRENEKKKQLLMKIQPSTKIYLKQLIAISLLNTKFSGVI